MTNTPKGVFIRGHKLSNDQLSVLAPVINQMMEVSMTRKTFEQRVLDELEAAGMPIPQSN